MAGRRLEPMNWSSFKALCQRFCTLEEIAADFDCSVDTIERRCKEEFDQTFAEVWQRFSARGRISLRRWQFEKAESGHWKALEFLGKQYLGQRDKVETLGDFRFVEKAYDRNRDPRKK